MTTCENENQEIETLKAEITALTKSGDMRQGLYDAASEELAELKGKYLKQGAALTETLGQLGLISDIINPS